MAMLKKAAAGQIGLGGFGDGSVVKLDDGSRLRLDDRVDFWPGTQAWRSVALGQDAPAQGVGMTSLLAYLKQQREAEGRPVSSPTPRHSARTVVCRYCGRLAELHGGLAVYPDRKDLEDRQFWVCWACDAWVGCRSGIDEPFGDLADEALRAARMSAHRAIDPVWKNGLMSKAEAYQWLAGRLQIPPKQCQIGLLSMEDCMRVGQAVWEQFGLTEERPDTHS